VAAHRGDPAHLTTGAIANRIGPDLVASGALALKDEAR
jgi:hypothetical protein